MLTVAIVAWGDRYEGFGVGPTSFLDALCSTVPCGTGLAFVDVRRWMPTNPEPMTKGKGKGKRKDKGQSPTGRRAGCSALHDARHCKDWSLFLDSVFEWFLDYVLSRALGGDTMSRMPLERWT